MLDKSLNELAVIALLRSDRVFDCCIRVMSEGFGRWPWENGHKVLKKALEDTLFHLRPKTSRIDDIERSLASCWQKGQGYSYQLDCLQEVAEHYLAFSGTAYEVKRSLTTQFQEVVNHVQPGFIVAVKVVKMVEKNQLSLPALQTLLDKQCPLAFPEKASNEPHADNHVHFGGVQGAQVLVRFLFDQVDQDALKSFEVPKLGGFSFINERQYSMEKIISVYRLLFDVFTQYCFDDKNDFCDEWELSSRLREALALRPLNLSNRLHIKHRLQSVRANSIQRIALMKMHEHADQNRHHQSVTALCVALIAQLHAKEQPPMMRTLTLALIHLVNILRAHVVMSGVGLTQFVQFFNSDVRQFNANSGNVETLNQLVERGNKASMKTTPPTEHFDWYAEILQKIAHISDTTLNWHGSAHFCLHFIRDKGAHVCDHDETRLHYDMRETAYELRKLLQTQVKHEITTRNFKERMTGSASEKVSVARFVRGFDVAGNENHHPIHIFAPALRFLREKPLPLPMLDGSEKLSKNRYLSIHAGEDFSHLATGMRYIDEAVRYCRMIEGDRIGHALALGVMPQLWAKRQGQAFVDSEDHLWDLVWLWHYAGELSRTHESARSMLHHYECHINAWLQDNGHEGVGLDDLWLYWLDRGNSRHHRNQMEDDESYRDRQYWFYSDVPEGKRKKLAKLRGFFHKHSKRNSRSYTLDLNITGKGRSVEGNALVDYEVTKDELQFLKLLQDHLMVQYDKKGIVIEACPSSNVSLGRFEQYHEHPIFRWFPPDKRLFAEYGFDEFGIRNCGEVAVCVNTDDPGIFPTNIEQEYELLRHAAIQDYGMSSQEAENWIERLKKRSLEVFEQSHLAP